jgi:hypothetical protein
MVSHPRAEILFPDLECSSSDELQSSFFLYIARQRRSSSANSKETILDAMERIKGCSIRPTGRSLRTFAIYSVNEQWHFVQIS